MIPANYRQVRGRELYYLLLKKQEPLRGTYGQTVARARSRKLEQIKPTSLLCKDAGAMRGGLIRCFITLDRDNTAFINEASALADHVVDEVGGAIAMP